MNKPINWESAAMKACKHWWETELKFGTAVTNTLGWQAAWDARGKHDADLCRNVAENHAEELDISDGARHCEFLIRNDK